MEQAVLAGSRGMRLAVIFTGCRIGFHILEYAKLLINKLIHDTGRFHRLSRGRQTC
jgi:hypothetical protein